MKNSSNRRRFNQRAALTLLASAWAGARLVVARAESATDSYPSRPVRWIVPTSSGAGTDFTARVFAQLASQAWSQPVIVDNRSGAAGMIGLSALAGAPPDGYTLGFFSVSQFIDAKLQNKFVFDARKDFTPISSLASTPLLLVANAATGIESLAQLISIAKSRPKELNYSSGGSGGVTHLAMEIFLKKAGIEIVHVPYKGSGPAIVDLLGGQVQLSFSTPATVMQHIKAGRLRALAVAADARTPLAPDVPTFAEAGLPGLSLSTWYGLFGPADLPPGMAERIASTVTDAARPAAVRDKMIADGIEPILSTPAEFTKFLDAESRQWTDAARDIGFQRDK